jgi:hypothetical protein
MMVQAVGTTYSYHWTLQCLLHLRYHIKTCRTSQLNWIFTKQLAAYICHKFYFPSGTSTTQERGSNISILQRKQRNEV